MHHRSSALTDKILMSEVLPNPSITAATLKKKYHELLKNVSIRTAQAGRTVLKMHPASGYTQLVRTH